MGKSVATRIGVIFYPPYPEYKGKRKAPKRQARIPCERGKIPYSIARQPPGWAGDICFHKSVPAEEALQLWLDHVEEKYLRHYGEDGHIINYRLEDCKNFHAMEDADNPSFCITAVLENTRCLIREVEKQRFHNPIGPSTPEPDESLPDTIIYSSRLVRDHLRDVRRWLYQIFSQQRTKKSKLNRWPTNWPKETCPVSVTKKGSEIVVTIFNKAIEMVLTDNEAAVVQALVQAFPHGLKKQELGSAAGTALANLTGKQTTAEFDERQARELLTKLRTNDQWGMVLTMPGTRARGGYRIANHPPTST